MSSPREQQCLRPPSSGLPPSTLPRPLPTRLPPRSQRLYVDALVVAVVGVVGVFGQSLSPQVFDISPDYGVGRLVEEGADGGHGVGPFRVAHHLEVVVGVSLFGDETAFHGGEYQVRGHASGQLSAISGQLFPEFRLLKADGFYPRFKNEISPALLGPEYLATISSIMRTTYLPLRA